MEYYLNFFFLGKIKREKTCKVPNILSDALSKRSVNVCHSFCLFVCFIRHCSKDSGFEVWGGPTTKLVYVLWKTTGLL